MHWFSVRYVSGTLFGIFWWYLVVIEEQDQMTCHIQEWQLRLFLLLELSPLLVFEFDFLSLLCNTNTLLNILMRLGTNVEQDEVTCCGQEWQLWRGGGGGQLLLFFFSKKPFLVEGYFCQFSINICCGYSLKMHLWEAFLMSTHNIIFYGEICKIILQLSLDTLFYLVHWQSLSCTWLSAILTVF